MSKVRELTDDEEDAFDGLDGHVNYGGDTAYCPHCHQNVDVSNAAIDENRKVITCPLYSCEKEFVIWTEIVPTTVPRFALSEIRKGGVGVTAIDLILGWCLWKRIP